MKGEHLRAPRTAIDAKLFASRASELTGASSLRRSASAASLAMRVSWRSTAPRSRSAGTTPSSTARRRATKYVSRRQVPRPRFLLSPAHTQDLAADGTPAAPKAARRHRDDAEAERILTKSLASRGIAVVPVSSRTAAAFASGAIRHEPRGNGSATRLYHFDDAGRLLILQLVPRVWRVWQETLAAGRV